jgi:iron complex outermembrane receptor protein
LESRRRQSYLSGDVFGGVNTPTPGTHIDLRGGNLLGHWQRRLDDESQLEVQAYYDHAGREISNGITDSLDTYDLSAQHSFALGENQRITWGGGYRVTSDRLTPGAKTSYLVPAHKILQLGNFFVQDGVALASNLKLTFGIKLEHNSYTGLEYMPDARLSWQAAPGTTLWAAVSRAVRSPSRFDRDLFNTGILAGGPDFQSERLIAYEAGYRTQPVANATLSVSVFYNVYDDLRTAEAANPGIFPLVLSNQMEGRTYGVETWGGYDVRSWWRLSAGFTALHKDLHLKPGSRDFFGLETEGNDPSTQVSFRSQMNLPHDLEFDFGLRAIHSLPKPAVPAYVAVDAHLGWNVSESLQFAVTGSNLLDSRHTEFIVASPPQREIRRTVYASARWGF